MDNSPRDRKTNVCKQAESRLLCEATRAKQCLSEVYIRAAAESLSSNLVRSVVLVLVLVLVLDFSGGHG